MTRWASNRPTHVPTRLRNQCLARDGAQCTATMLDGTRCPETDRSKLEAHHLHGWQPGEDITVDDLQTLCKWHHDKITQRQAAQARKKNPPPRHRRTFKHPGLI